MADIFISYNQADRDLVRLTAAFLEAQGYSVWWDTSLLAGDDFQLKILDEVAKARAVIVIWTPNSVKSTWVRSEAGRAQSDHKLIPLKAAGVTYDEIPPPFNLLHTEDASNRDAVLLSVKAELGKAPPAPVLIKRARYEVLSWVGVLGATITLFGNLKGALHIAKLARELTMQWEEFCRLFWRAILFLLPSIHQSDAIAMTAFSFAALTITSAGNRDGRTSGINVASLVGFWLGAWILILASVGLAIFKDSDDDTPSVISLFVALGLEVLSPEDTYPHVALLLALAIVVIPVYIGIVTATGKWVSAQHLQFATIPVIICAAISGCMSLLLFGWHDSVETRSELFMAFFPWTTSVLVAVQFPVAVGALVGFAIARWFGLSVSLRAVNLRLWHIIAGIALLIAVNYGMLWLEKQPWAAEVLK